MLKESHEFARAYTAEVERKPTRNEVFDDLQPVAEKQKSVVYSEGSMEFEEALKKISSGVLELMNSQFSAHPKSLVVGKIFSDTSSKTRISSETQDEQIFSFDENETD